MKLLIVTSRFPYPLEKGDKLRIFYQIKELAKYHQIVLCAVTDTTIAKQHYQMVARHCVSIHIFQRSKWTIVKNLALAGFKGLPFQVGYFYDKAIKKRIHRIIKIEQPHHIYCQLFRAAAYVREISCLKTIDYMDTFSVGAKRWASHANFWIKPFLRREAKKIAQYEQAIFKDFAHHTIISEQDKNLLDISEKAKIQVIPNGVDTDFFHPLGQEKQYDLAFVGNMGYQPNVEAVRFLVEEILPKLLLTHPDIKILIAGARPAPYIQQLNHQNITVSGWVEDIRTAYASAKIFVAPLFTGIGLQNKILEAMAMGVPCITTSLVNNAIQAIPNKSILIADDAKTFVAQIHFLQENIHQQVAIKKEALTFVHNNFSWSIFVKQLNNLFIE